MAQHTPLTIYFKYISMNYSKSLYLQPLQVSEVKTNLTSVKLNNEYGKVAEWLNAHAWKACLQRCNGGSNPPLSAIIQKTLKPLRFKFFWFVGDKFRNMSGSFDSIDFH